MISFTLNNSVTNLTFTINSNGPKMKLRRPAYGTQPFLDTKETWRSNARKCIRVTTALSVTTVGDR